MAKGQNFRYDEEKDRVKEKNMSLKKRMFRSNMMILFLALFSLMMIILLVLLAIVLFITGQFIGGMVLIALAFLASPFGIPAIAGHLAGAVYAAKDALGRFISG